MFAKDKLNFEEICSFHHLTFKVIQEQDLWEEEACAGAFNKCKMHKNFCWDLLAASDFFWTSDPHLHGKMS